MMDPTKCTCHCGGAMFYRHMHAESCALSREGEEAPKSELQALREERDRLRTRALTAVERWRAQTNVKEGIAFRMAMKALETALTPVGGGRNDGITEESTVL